MAVLDQFLTNPFNAPFQSNVGTQTGFMGSNLDLLLEQARRNQNIRSSKLFDYIQVENDPNFSRGAAPNSKIYTKAVSDLSITTQIVTVINSTLAMSGIQEFIPANIRELLLNYNSLADTAINASSNIKQVFSFQQIEKAFLGDLTLQFGNQTISFNQIALMADNVLKSTSKGQTISNTGIRPLLSIGLQQFLPADMAAIFNDAQYLDMLANIFGDQSPNIAIVNQLFTTQTNAYAATVISDIVTPDIYVDPPLTLNDPLGLSLQSQFNGELNTSYVNQITNMVNNNTIIPDQDKQEIIDFLINDAQNNITEGFKGGIGLPSITECVNGVIVDSNNKSVDAVLAAFENFTTDLLTQIGIAPPASGTTAIDHLQNLKLNLRKRIEMQRVGGMTEDFTAIDNYLKSVLLNQDITAARLQELNTFIDDLLKENVKVC